jgi:hypothetical protein
VAGPNAAEGEPSIMKKNEVQVGGTYLAKVGARSVEVRIESENAKGGWNAVSVASGKPIRVKNPQHLRPAKSADATGPAVETDAAADAPGDAADIEQPAPADDADLVPLTALDKQKRAAGKSKRGGGGRGKKTATTTVTAPAKEKRAPKPKPAKEAKPKKMSCLDAAAAVLKSKGEPMRCIDMVAAMKEKGLWETSAPTPAATLYSAILRELTAKGRDSRFKKTDRGHFGLNA